MTFEVPKPFVWDESFSVKYDDLNEGHKAIFVCIINCTKDPSSAALITKWLEVAANHFKNEEGMMDQAKYADVAIHKEIHKAFLDNIKLLKAPLDEASLLWAKQWLVNHIKGIDFKYKGLL